MGDIDEKVSEAVERASEGGRLNSIVAILVALAATCMALDNVKDGNIGQGMAQAQAKMVDTWSYYQAKSTKQNLAESTLDELVTMKSLGATKGGGVADAAVGERIENYKEQVARYEKEKAAIKTEAEGYQKQYDDLNIRDDQFDLSDAAFSLAIALLGVTALTRKRWLIVMALAFLAVGVTFGLAGFFSWPLHPDKIMSWLS
jgi:hypothetical protein